MKQALTVLGSVFIAAALSGCIIAPTPPPRPVVVYRPPPPVYYPPPRPYHPPPPRPYYPQPGVTVGVHIN